MAIRKGMRKTTATTTKKNQKPRKVTAGNLKSKPVKPKESNIVSPKDIDSINQNELNLKNATTDGTRLSQRQRHPTKFFGDWDTESKKEEIADINDMLDITTSEKSPKRAKISCTTPKTSPSKRKSIPVENTTNREKSKVNTGKSKSSYGKSKINSEKSKTKNYKTPIKIKLSPKPSKSKSEKEEPRKSDTENKESEIESNETTKTQSSNKRKQKKPSRYRGPSKLSILSLYTKKLEPENHMKTEDDINNAKENINTEENTKNTEDNNTNAEEKSTKKETHENFTEKNKNLVSCNICNATLSNRSIYRHLVLHEKIKTSHNIDVVKCKLCEKSFASYALLQRHKCQDKPPNFKCPICKKGGFNSKVLLNTHLLFHYTTEGSANSKTSKKQKINSGRLKNVRSTPPVLPANEEDRKNLNVNIKREKRKVQCKICGKWLASNWVLTRHGSQHQPTVKQKVLKKDTAARCLLCLKVFANHWSLKIHTYTHMPELKQFRCEICPDKYFATKALLDKHLMYHSDKKTYKCGFCDKMFKVTDDRARHEKITHLKAYSCNCSICDKWFVSQRSLKQHMNRHTNELFECSFCPKKFSSKGGLKYHIKTHDNKKEFSCEICSREFYTEAKLKRHLGTHIKAESFFNDLSQGKDSVEKEDIDGDLDECKNDGSEMDTTS